MFGQLRRGMWISVIIIIASFLLFGSAIMWLANDIKGQSNKVQEKGTLLAGRVHSLELLADLKRNAPEVKTVGDQLNRLLPGKDNLLDFPRWLDGLSRVDKVALTFSFQGATAAAQGDQPGYVGFNMDTNGPYDNLVTFFSDLETRSNQFLVSLDSFDFVKSDKIYRGLVLGRVFFK